MRRPWPKQSLAARLGTIAVKAKTRAKKDRARQLAAEGATMEEAAEALGCTVCGLRFFLYDHFGSKKWPPAA